MAIWTASSRKMPLRQEDPNPPYEPWTCANVERWLKTAFRAIPYTLIYALGGNTLRSAAAEQPSATFDSLARTRAVLVDGIPEKAVVTRECIRPEGGGTRDASLARNHWPSKTASLQCCRSLF